MEQQLFKMKQADQWDIVFAMLLKIGNSIFKDVPTPCWDIKFLDSLKKIQYPYVI